MARQKQTELNLETVVRWASTLSKSKLWELINALLALAEAVEDSDRSLSTNGSNGGGSGTTGGYIEIFSS